MSVQQIIDGPESPAAGGDVATFDLSGERPCVRNSLTALARLLCQSVAGAPRDLETFLTTHLGLRGSDRTVVGTSLTGIDLTLAQVELGRVLAGAPDAVLADDSGTSAPGYCLVTVDVDDQVSAPNDLAAFLPAGSAFDFPVVVRLTWINGVEHLQLHVDRIHADAARKALAELLENARTTGNFFRGKTVRVGGSDRHLHLTPIEPSRTRRQEVVHADRVWDEIDTTVGGLTKHGEVLAASGLGASRGVLIAGPPGVGKTALCRVIAAELPAGTTVLVVDATTSARGLGLLYESLDRLSPAVVILDDLDLLAGDRRAGTDGPALREFLTHLDGFHPPGAVLTLATTNVTETIDPALIRPGRFDTVIEVGLPDRQARERILRSYLERFGEFEYGRLADATDGASGADLREVVRRAVLERGAQLTTAALLEVITTGRWSPRLPTGQYL